MRVKICGITRYSDAIDAYKAGADAIGFVFAKSKRQITAKECKCIMDKLPPFCYTVGVFKDNGKGEIWNTLKYCGLSCLQFHGAENEEFCNSFGLPYIKGFSIENADDIEKIKDFPCTINILVDGQSPGSGRSFDHTFLSLLPENKNVILAGGLNPDNISELKGNDKINALDVSTGVEFEPGIKDLEKVKKFIRIAKGVEK